MYRTLLAPQMRIGPLLQLFCSSCGKILKESSTIELQNGQLKEECPSCGSLLIDTLENRRLCIKGEQKYAQLLIDRLCVHSMLPKRHGGIEDYLKIISIDAGNCTDV